MLCNENPDRQTQRPLGPACEVSGEYDVSVHPKRDALSRVECKAQWRLYDFPAYELGSSLREAHSGWKEPLCHYTIPSSCGASEPSTTRWDFKQPFLRGHRIYRVAVMLLCQATRPRLFEILTRTFLQITGKSTGWLGGYAFLIMNIIRPFFLMGDTDGRNFWVSATCPPCTYRTLIRID